MQPNSVLHSDYLDILFNNRNKDYGGYELRRHYSGRALKGLSTIVFISILAITLNAFREKPEPVYNSIVDGIVDMTELVYPPTPPPPPAPIAPPSPPPPSPASQAPTIVNDADVRDKIPEPPDAPAPGNPGGTPGGTSPVIPAGPVGNGPPAAPVVTPPATKEPGSWAEVMPAFNGNMKEYLNKNLRYPESARESSISGRVTVQFIVDEEGEITGAKVVRGIGGGCDEEALRVINKMPKWKPGMQNGKAVKIYFTLPIVFQLNE